MNDSNSRQMRHAGIEDVFVWVIRNSCRPSEPQHYSSGERPGLFLAVLNVRVCAGPIGLH